MLALECTICREAIDHENLDVDVLSCGQLVVYTAGDLVSYDKQTTLECGCRKFKGLEYATLQCKDHSGSNEPSVICHRCLDNAYVNTQIDKGMQIGEVSDVFKTMNVCECPFDRDPLYLGTRSLPSEHLWPRDVRQKPRKTCAGCGTDRADFLFIGDDVISKFNKTFETPVSFINSVFAPQVRDFAADQGTSQDVRDVLNMFLSSHSHAALSQGYADNQVHIPPILDVWATGAFEDAFTVFTDTVWTPVLYVSQTLELKLCEKALAVFDLNENDTLDVSVTYSSHKTIQDDMVVFQWDREDKTFVDEVGDADTKESLETAARAQSWHRRVQYEDAIRIVTPFALRVRAGNTTPMCDMCIQEGKGPETPTVCRTTNMAEGHETFYVHVPTRPQSRTTVSSEVLERVPFVYAVDKAYDPRSETRHVDFVISAVKRSLVDNGEDDPEVLSEIDRHRDTLLALMARDDLDTLFALPRLGEWDKEKVDVPVDDTHQETVLVPVHRIHITSATTRDDLWKERTLSIEFSPVTGTAIVSHDGQRAEMKAPPVQEEGGGIWGVVSAFQNMFSAPTAKIKKRE